jgi:chromosome segregation ATPase
MRQDYEGELENQ